jgi:hypothetical protein
MPQKGKLDFRFLSDGGFHPGLGHFLKAERQGLASAGAGGRPSWLEIVQRARIIRHLHQTGTVQRKVAGEGKGH